MARLGAAPDAGCCVGSGRPAQASCWRAGAHRGHDGEYEQRQQDHDEHDGPQQRAEDKRENDQHLRLGAQSADRPFTAPQIGFVPAASAFTRPPAAPMTTPPRLIPSFNFSRSRSTVCRAAATPRWTSAPSSFCRRRSTCERGQQPLRKALDELRRCLAWPTTKLTAAPHLDPHRVFGPLPAAVSWTPSRLPARRRTRCCYHPPPRRCPAAATQPRVSGPLPAAVGEVPAASGSAPNAVGHPRRWCPAERLPDRPSTRHDRRRLSEPGYPQLPATPGRRPASPACRHPGFRPGGSGWHPCLFRWRSMSWLAPSSSLPQDQPTALILASGTMLTEQECHRLAPTLVRTRPAGRNPAPDLGAAREALGVPR